MSRSVYDTRFFIEHFYSTNLDTLSKTKEEIRKTKQRYVSAITLHEVFRLSLERDGREVAKIRRGIIEQYFKVLDVDGGIAVTGAELRHRHRIPMGDSLIVATALCLEATCITDDPHFKKIGDIRTRWI
jgi:predicted nucleic acid-binding protein